jgi:hypothetical protein
VAPQYGTKEQFYSTVHYIILKSDCEAQRASKILTKCRRKKPKLMHE